MVDVNLIALRLIPLNLIALGLIALGLIALGLIALGLIALGLIALRLVAWGASYLTAAGRTSPPVAGPVSTVGVPVGLTLVWLSLALLTRVLLHPILLIRGQRLRGTRLRTIRLRPVRLRPVRLRPVRLGPIRRGPVRRDGTRRDSRGNLLLGSRGIGVDSRGEGFCPSRGGSTSLATRWAGGGDYRAVERGLLSGRTSLTWNSALALFDRGDQVILTHTGDVGDAHLASHLAQLRHHHSRQPGTATRRRPVARRRHSVSSLVGWALVRRFRSYNVAAHQVDIAHAGPS
jgi:hypothetical protein